MMLTYHIARYLLIYFILSGRWGCVCVCVDMFYFSFWLALSQLFESQVPERQN